MLTDPEFLKRLETLFLLTRKGSGVNSALSLNIYNPDARSSVWIIGFPRRAIAKHLRLCVFAPLRSSNPLRLCVFSCLGGRKC